MITILRRNPLLQPLLNWQTGRRVSLLLVTLVFGWIVVLSAVDQAKFALIRGVRWQVLSWFMVATWFLPALSLIYSVQLARVKVQQDVYQVVKTTTLLTSAITLGYTAEALYRLRWMLIASPFLIMMASTYPTIFGGEVVPTTELFPLALTWLLAHVAAVALSTWGVLRWGQGASIWLSMSAVSGVGLAVLGLLRDRFAFSGNMTYACPVRIDTAPLPWLLVLILLAFAAALTLLPERVKLAHGRVRLGLLLALIMSSTAGSGWLRNWQRHLERSALLAIEETNFTIQLARNNWAKDLDHCDWPDVQCQCGRVQWVDLRERAITGTLPPQIRNLYYVQHLKLRNNDLSGIPPQIGGMRHLRELSAVDNEITELPRQIGRLHMLTELVLHINQIETLPSSIGRMDSLILLDVSNNQLEYLPISIGHMESLQLLNISSNNLDTLPRELAEVDTLETIWVNFNNLSELPPEIGGLPALDDIAVNDNQLTALPTELGQLESLQHVSASNNQLTTLPAELVELPSLEGMQLFGNPLQELPASACRFEGLNVEEEILRAACVD